MLERRPASRCSWIRWQQQQCRWAFFLNPLTGTFLLRGFLKFFGLSRMILPLQSRSKNARPSAGPLPRAGFGRFWAAIISSYKLPFQNSTFTFPFFIFVFFSFKGSETFVSSQLFPSCPSVWLWKENVFLPLTVPTRVILQEDARLGTQV